MDTFMRAEERRAGQREATERGMVAVFHGRR